MPNTSDHSTELLKRLLNGYMWKHKGKLTASMAAMVVVAVCMSLLAYYIQPLFDVGLIGKKIGVLNTVVAALVGITIVKGLAYFVQGYYMEYIGQRIIADLQQDLYKKLLKQDLIFFQANPTAMLTSRFISDLIRMKMAITQVFSSGLRDTAIIIGLMANMLWQDWGLTLLTVFILPPTGYIIAKSGKLIRKYSRINQEATGRLAHMISQTLGHIRQVQSFTMENKEQKRINAGVDEVFESSISAARVRAFSSPVVEIVGTIVIGVMMLYAGYMIKNGSMTTGQFASFMASLVIIIRPIKGLTSLNHILQEGLAATARTFNIMDAPIHIKPKHNAPELKVTKGNIEFKDLTLTYPDGTVAIEGLNLEIPAGKTVALVGTSGAGKSTILNLIPRFFDPSAGEVLIDGQDIKNVNLNSLRQHISLVTQDVAIFDETAYSNIAYGNPKATRPQIEKAAKMAAAHKFIGNLPQKYETQLGEDGVKISGGQKQRIAIARALVKDAPILLLDEATSNLDTESERKVQQALEKLMQGRTTLIIAHRLSTIIGADKIYVLKDGKVVENGTHKQLLQNKANYSRLWEIQSSS